MANIKIEESNGMISKGTFCINDATISFEIRNADLHITSSEVPMEAKVALIEELLEDFCIRLNFEGHKLFRRMDIMKEICYGEGSKKESEGNLLHFPEDKTATA